MSKAYMGSSWNVDDNQQPGVRFWKHLECIFGNGKGICHMYVFCIFAKIEIVTKSNFW